MKVLVLGGTGAMGSHLVEILSNAGIITVVTTRKYRPSRNNIKYLQGNAHEMDFLYTILGTVVKRIKLYNELIANAI